MTEEAARRRIATLELMLAERNREVALWKEAYRQVRARDAKVIDYLQWIRSVTRLYRPQVIAEELELVMTWLRRSW